jgi:uncharacterized damage-inducible protein DinB
MANELDRIAQLLENTFNKQPWYGSSIMDILKGLTPEVINKSIGQTHSIGELVLHMIAWRTFAIKRLQGDGNFQVTEDLNFPTPDSWEKTLNQLQQSQIELIEAVKKFPESKLGEIVPSKEYTYDYYTLLHGIAQHDIYHLGQIGLLKKAFES